MSRNSERKDKGDDVLAVLCVLLAAACGYDYTKNRIPNSLLIVMAVSGMVHCFETGGIYGIACYFAKLAAVWAFFYLFFKLGTMGAGDVKLLGITAGYLPADKILCFLFISLLFGAIISLIKMWKNNNFFDRMRVLLSYMARTVQSGRWQLYTLDPDRPCTCVCLSGPVLASILLHIGGAY